MIGGEKPVLVAPKNVAIKPRQNDRNISTQHIATLLGATCWVRLATLLRRVATCCDMLSHCWLKFENGQTFRVTFADFAWRCSSLARFVQHCCSRACALVRFSYPTCRSTLHQGGQTRATCCAQQWCDMLCWNSLKCSDCLVGACKCWINNFGICSVEILLSFAPPGL